MDRKLVKIDKKWGIASYKNFKIVTCNCEGDEIHGCLFKDDKRVSDSGWWRTNDIVKALDLAIKAYNAGLL